MPKSETRDIFVPFTVSCPCMALFMEKMMSPRVVSFLRRALLIFDSHFSTSVSDMAAFSSSVRGS